MASRKPRKCHHKKDKFDFDFVIVLMRRDLCICLDEAKSDGIKLPLTE